MFDMPPIDDIVALALAEDLGVDPSAFAPGAPRGIGMLDRDVTSAATVGLDAQFRGTVVARQDGVICGLPVAAAVFEAHARASDLFDEVECFPLVAEGSRVEAGRPVAEVTGLAASVLAAERTALDFLMVLSGIATTTSEWVALAGEHMKVCDTRKTLPGMRLLSKYAVRVGGGCNHRTGLHDMILVKDNHLRAAGGVAAAVAAARVNAPGLEVEIEADTAEQALEAVRAGAEAVLLDNMDDERIAETVAACRIAAQERGRPVVLEASGTIDRARVPLLRMTGVDRISASALTLTAPMDFALDES